MIPTKWLKHIARLTARKQLNFRFVHLSSSSSSSSSPSSSSSSSSSSPLRDFFKQPTLKLSLWLLHESLSILCAQCLLLPECSYLGDLTW